MALSRLERSRLFGVDHAPDSLQFAREQLRETQVELFMGDIYHLPFGDKCFDKVLLSEVLEHLEDDELALHQIWRVLRPQGTLVVTVPYRHYPVLYDPINHIFDDLLDRPIRSGPLAGAWTDHRRLYGREEVLQLLRQSGFTVLDCRMLTSYCFPFTHNLVYGMGKGLLEQRMLPSVLFREVDRFHPEAGRRSPWNPMTWLMRVVNWIDQFNSNGSGRTRYVNIAARVRKPSERGPEAPA
jgi:SAM-dependent methyltransferase